MKAATTALLVALAPAAPALRSSTPSAPLTAAPFDGGRLVTSEGIASSALAPDGDELYVMQPHAAGWTITVAKRRPHGWSSRIPAPFSGNWRDLDPAIAPDGRSLVFASNRPATAQGPAIDSMFRGARQPGQGMNLWQVQRRGAGWTAPVRLSDAINACPMTFAPSIAGNGDLYYIGCQGPGPLVQLLHARREGRGFARPSAVTVGSPGDSIRDPAIAPDQSFIVVSVRSKPDARYRLAFARRRADGWGPLVDLGNDVNGDGTSMGSQLARGGRLLLFYSDRSLPAPASAGGDVTQLWAVDVGPLRQPSRRSRGAAR